MLTPPPPTRSLSRQVEPRALTGPTALRVPGCPHPVTFGVLVTFAYPVEGGDGGWHRGHLCPTVACGFVWLPGPSACSDVSLPVSLCIPHRVLACPPMSPPHVRVCPHVPSPCPPRPFSVSWSFPPYSHVSFSCPFPVSLSHVPACPPCPLSVSLRVPCVPSPCHPVSLPCVSPHVPSLCPLHVLSVLSCPFASPSMSLHVLSASHRVPVFPPCPSVSPPTLSMSLSPDVFPACALMCLCACPHVPATSSLCPCTSPNMSLCPLTCHRCILTSLCPCVSPRCVP